MVMSKALYGAQATQILLLKDVSLIKMLPEPLTRTILGHPGHRTVQLRRYRLRGHDPPNMPDHH